MLKLISLLAQFYKNSVAALGMYERDEFVVGPDLWLFAEKLEAFLFQACHLTEDVSHGKGDMMNALTFSGDEFCDGTLLICCFKKLYFIGTNLKEGRFDALGQNLLNFVMRLVEK